MAERGVAVRTERPGDHDRVREIVTAAFEGDAEARLVDRMRGRVSPEVSLVAERAGSLLGHVYLTPVRVGVSGRPAMGLGPVSVDPAWQRQGIGSLLCRAGLEACLAAGEPVIFVLGHAAYYPRFGFEPALPHGLYYRSREFAPSFFVAELREGALAGYEGEVVYHPAFDET